MKGFTCPTKTSWLSPEGIYYTGGSWQYYTAPVYGWIFEIKVKSPFGYDSGKDFDYLFNLANSTNVSWLSIHTDSRWGGSWDMLKEARSRTNKFILAKGIHSSDRDVDKAISIGADAALVVGRIPHKSVLPYTWLEPLGFSEYEMEDRGVPTVLNRRDLKTGHRREIPKIQYTKELPRHYIVASFVHPDFKIDRGGLLASGALIGENMELFIRQYYPNLIKS